MPIVYKSGHSIMKH